MFKTALAAAVLFSLPALSLDCKSIQHQIDSLPPTGGEVVISAGTYTCSTAIVLSHSHLSLRAEGEVILNLSDKADTPVIVMGDLSDPPKPLEDISVEGFRIFGNKDHQPHECWGGECGGGLHAIRNNGITVRNLLNGHIKDVYVNGARSGGVVSELGTVSLHIENLTSVQNYFDGLAGCDTSYSLFENLHLEKNNAAGVSMDINYNHNTFKNLHLVHNHDVGVFMRSANYNVFENMKVENSGNYGIFVSQSDGPETCPQNNEFYNLEVAHSKKEAFRLNSDCKNNRLTGSITFMGNKGCLSELISGEMQIENPNLMVCH